MSITKGQNNGTLYIGSVKWASDTENVMLFDSKDDRTTFLKSHLKLVSSTFDFTNINTYVDIDDNIKGAEQINYCMYIQDSEISTTPYCCFVTNYEYLSPKTTRLYLKLDVFQQYIYDTTFYRSMVSRAIVSKSDDVIGAHIEPEPIGADVSYQGLIKALLTDDDFSPQWVLHMASYYNKTTKKYEYGGRATANTYGEYGRFINSKAEIDDIIAQYGRKSMDDIIDNTSINWKSILNSFLSGGTTPASVGALTSATSIAELQDHRDELIGLYAIPKWVYTNRTTTDDHATNGRVQVSETISLNNSTLINGYTPRNKKMLTSIARAYILANRTGLRISFKPELFDSNSTTVNLIGITMSTSGYQYSVTGYRDYQLSYGEIAYNSERRVGYDANTGLNKTINTLNVLGQAVTGAGAVAGGIVSGNASAVVSGAGALVSSFPSAIDQLGQHNAGFGSNGDLLRITGGRARLRWYEVCPQLDECQAMDDYFDKYGYSINKIKSIRPYMTNRSNWNYIKTAGVHLYLDAPKNYADEMRQLFDTGITIWHSYNNFGDYTKSNN